MKRTFLVSAIFYLFVAAIIFPYVRWYADNPDTFQYLAIANKYISGDWSHAINGYWSPMISWLLIIPAFVFSDELIAFKILQLIIGLFTLFQLIKLLNKLSLSNKIEIVLIIVFTIFISDYALLNASADLLFMSIALTLLNLLIEDFFQNKRSALLTGTVGALLYLSKAFGFPFFIGITFILIFIRLKKPIENNFKINLIIMFSAFFIICSIWIVPLSLHYGHFTISESAAFNMSRDVAPLPGRSEELAILGNGLFAPGINSYSAWESPGDYISKERVTIFNSPSDYFKVIKRNILSIYYFDFRNQEGIIFLILLIFSLLFKWKEVFSNRTVITMLLFIFLIYGGYSLILYHLRYAWVNSILMLILSLFFIQILFYNGRMKIVSIIISISVILLAVKRPIKEILFTQDKKISVQSMFDSIGHPFDTLWIVYRPDHLLVKSIEEIRQKNIIHGNIASLKARNNERYPYTSSLRISQALKLPYFGQLNDQLNNEQQESELKEMNIDYLITWKNTEWENKKPIYNNIESGIKIYSLK